MATLTRICIQNMVTLFMASRIRLVASIRVRFDAESRERHAATFEQSEMTAFGVHHPMILL